MKPKPISDAPRRALTALLVTVGASLMTMLPARADIFGYLDAAGDTHFATEKIDERYQLFVKGDHSFDSTDLTDLTVSRPVRHHSALFNVLTEHPNLKKYEPTLLAAAREFKVDATLMKAMMAAESGFNPAAVSPKGAIGLMQILPATAARYGIEGDVKRSLEQKLSDPKINLRLAARYLRDLNQMFPQQQALVIASYNAGEGAVRKYRNAVPPFPETRSYVQLVSEFYQFYLPLDTHAPLPKGDGTGNHRIHLTIPGRANLPAPVTTLN